MNLTKVEFLHARPGAITYSGNAFEFPGGRVPLSELQDRWRETLASTGENLGKHELGKPGEAWVITARVIAEHGCTQLGLIEDGKVVPARMETEYWNDSGEQVLVSADPVTRETVYTQVRQPKAKLQPPPAPSATIPEELKASLETPIEPAAEPAQPEPLEPSTRASRAAARKAKE